MSPNPKYSPAKDCGGFDGCNEGRDEIGGLNNARNAVRVNQRQQPMEPSNNGDTFRDKLLRPAAKPV